MMAAAHIPHQFTKSMLDSMTESKLVYDAMSDSKGGRPPLPDGQAREIRLNVRVRPAAYARLQAAAKRAGVTVSSATRTALAEWVDRQS